MLLLHAPFTLRGGKLDSAVGVERSDSMATLEAFAYLAARCARGLPSSFPGTTGAPRPMTGGTIVRPCGARDA